MKTTLRKGENDRRRVLRLLGTSSLLATFYSQSLIALTDNTSATTSRKTTSNNVNASSLDISVFSKHLQFLNYEDMAEAAKEIGFVMFCPRMSKTTYQKRLKHVKSLALAIN